MPVPDNPSAASAGSTHLAATAPADLSLSQSISASASDLKRPASAASSIDDSQTLSRTKAAKSHYARAARAFLAKDLPTALVQSQLAADLIGASNQLGSSLTASAFLQDSDLDVQKLVEKIAILRLTVFTQVYTDSRASASIADALAQAKIKADSDTTAIDRVSLLLAKQPLSLISHLWFEALRLCTHTSAQADAPSLDPTPETIHLAIELPASVVSSAVLAALRLDALEPAARTGTNAARLIAEWYLASFSSAFGAAPPTPKAAAAYENIVGLYALHVLASRLGEWEYAREFVGYSSLPESVKFGLLEQIGEAQTHLTGQTQREHDAIASAQKAYADEKAKRDAEEKQAKQAAAAAAANAANKGANKAGSKARDVASGIGNFLARKPDSAGKDAAAAQSSSSSSSSSPATSGSSSESGGRSRRERSQSPAYFSPRSGAAESSSSSSTSPAISPGSTRSVEGSHKAAAAVGGEEEAKQARRAVRRSSSSRSSDAGNESSTSAASNHSRRSARKEARESKETRFKDDAGYASTRAHLSRYMEGDHHHAGAAAHRRDPARGTTSSSSILSTITALFDVRKASQPRTWLMSAIVVMLVFYRVVRRTPAGGATSNSASATRRNAAAREARNKLVGRTAAGGSTGSSLLGFNWIVLVWSKVLATIKMGTQVTYL